MRDSDTGIEFRQATIEEIFELRFAVLRPGQAPVKLYFPGDGGMPPGTWHFGAFLGVRNVGCLTLLAAEWEGRAALQLRGMAVAAELRGRGVGRGLLQAAGAGAEGAAALWWCNARVEAVGFYERNGWRVVSEEFMVAGVGRHRKMVRE